MKCFVTGASGFIGANLVHELNARGHSVRALLRPGADQCGLKGFRIGDAQISHIHANIMVSIGRATARDVRSLIAHAQQCVQDKFGQRLEPEIGFIGEF